MPPRRSRPREAIRTPPPERSAPTSAHCPPASRSRVRVRRPIPSCRRRGSPRSSSPSAPCLSRGPAARAAVASRRRARDHRRHSGALRRALAALRRAQNTGTRRAGRARLLRRAPRRRRAGSHAHGCPPLLADKGLATETATTCGRLLAQLDELLYRPDAADTLPEVVRALRNTLPAVDDALDKPPRAKSADGALLLLLLVVSPALLAQPTTLFAVSCGNRPTRRPRPPVPPTITPRLRKRTTAGGRRGAQRAAFPQPR
jgi:hypothetical protein